MRKPISKLGLILFIFLTFLLILIAVIYLPHVGRGFVLDDFIWLENATEEGKLSLWKPFTFSTGFYRPGVSLSFGIQAVIHGLNPRPFGIFNLILHGINIILVFFLLYTVEETRKYSFLTTFLFALNSKGVRMAVGWISGRTTLLFSCFLLFSLLLFYQGRKKGKKFFYILGMLSFFISLLFKETALAFPLFLFLYLSLEEKDLRKGLKVLIPVIPALIAYFLLRALSDAFYPWNAPEYYRLHLSLPLILKNLREYFLRSSLLDLALIVILSPLLLIGKKHGKNSLDWRAIITGSVWFLAFISPVILIPVRSDLYSYFSGIGLHLAFASLLIYLWNSIRNKAIFSLVFSLILILWIGYLKQGAMRIEARGRASQRFVESFTKKLPASWFRTSVIVMDKDFGRDKNSPYNTVKYGFQSLLKIYFPEKELEGKIIPEKGFQDNCDFLFVWARRKLQGPFPCHLRR